MNIIICNECGYFKGWFGDIEKCPVCNNNLEYITSVSEKEYFAMSDAEAEQFAINYVGHDFDPELKMKRQNYEKNRRAEIDEICQERPVSDVECPYCHSNNTKKITTTAKIVNTALFGWFGTKRLKEWHCNNCKSDF